MTVYLSLTLTILLSLVLALLHGARVGAVCMETECVADIAANAVLSEFNKALFEQFDLLLVDSSFREFTPSVDNVQERLRYYAEGNLSSPLRTAAFQPRSMTALEAEEVLITEYSVATDGGYSVLQRQILEYMKAEPVENLLSELSGHLATFENAGIGNTNVEDEIAKTKEELSNVENLTIKNEDGEEEVVELDNPADQVWNDSRYGLVDLLMPDGKEVSTATVDLSAYASARTLAKGTGLDESCEMNAMDPLLINLYMAEKCGYFGRTYDKSALKYQLEYLIAGKANDHDNLEAVAYQLLLWREASNLAHILSSPAKMAQVEALAASVAALTLLPWLQPVVKYSIILAWSFAESMVDIRALYKGEKVPLIKTDESWHLSIENLASYKSHLDVTKGSGHGLAYVDYLKIMVFMKGRDVTIPRLANLMEMDVRKAEGTSLFCLDHCLDCFTVYLKTRSKFGVGAYATRTAGYEMY